MNWLLLSQYAAPVLAAFVGAWIGRFVEKRPRLISFLTHASAVSVPIEGKISIVHAHSIVVRNAGKRPANNVRLGHTVLPHFNVHPRVQHRVDDCPGGTCEIVFPVLVPGEQLTINYMYGSDLLVGDIHTYAKSDEGMAKIVTALPTPQAPPWLSRTITALAVVGLITALYFIVESIRFLVANRVGG